MTKRIVRGYTAAASLLAFSGAWLATSRHPFPARPDTASTSTVSADDPRVQALNAREARLRVRARAVARILAERTTDAPRPPRVRVVTLPPVTGTRSS